MKASLQLPLDLGHLPALGRDDFLLAPCNEVAVSWVDRWPDWPDVALALHGPPACGKTHLCHAWRTQSGAIDVAAAALAAHEPRELIGKATTITLEDVDSALATGGLAEERLLHFYNLVGERGGQVLLTGRTPPARWPVDLPDLRSRLRAVTAVGMVSPDDTLIEAVLMKLFADRQLRVDAGVARFLVTHMERSFAAAHAIVAAMDDVALADRRKITVSLARRVLAEQTF